MVPLLLYILAISSCHGWLHHHHKLPYTVTYTDKDEPYYEQQQSRILFTRCPWERKPPEYRTSPDDIHAYFANCIEHEQTRPGNTCEYNDWCKTKLEVPRNLSDTALSLSVGLRYSCQANNTSMLLSLRWGSISITLTCTNRTEQLVEAKSEGEEHVVSYWKRLNATDGVIHIFTKMSRLHANGSEIQGPGLIVDKTFRNAEEMTPAKTATSSISHEEEDYTHIYLSAKGLKTSETGSILAINFLSDVNHYLQIHDEYQYMELLAEGVPYPECLCPPGTGVEGTDMCNDGTGRLTQEPDQYFLPVTGLHDGIWDASLHYGYWGAPRTDLYVILTFSVPALLTKLELYLSQQSFSISKHSLAPGNSILHVQLKEINNSGVNPRWEIPYGEKSFQRFVWDLEDWHTDVITTSLHFTFPGDRHVDYQQYPSSLRERNMLHEFIIYGREMFPKEDDNRCSCFPGNEQKNTSCGECNRCRCRDGFTSRNSKTCAPYIDVIEPNFGPASGGTVVTIKGKLLKPQLKLNIKSVVHMETFGNSTRPILYTDDSITYTTEPIAAASVGKELSVWVELILDSVQYHVMHLLTFTFLPDPIIEHVTPYRAFLTGGSAITVYGRFLDSVSLHGTNKILTIADSASNGECRIESGERMVCTLPEFLQLTTLRTSIGFLLDGVHSYRNLSHVFQDFYIYPPPSFFLGEFKYKHDKLTLKGESLGSCCTKDDYSVFINGERCVNISLGGDILTCDFPDNSMKADVGRIMVKIDNLEFSIGHLDMRDGLSLTTLIGVIIGTLVVLVVVLLISILLWRRHLRKTHVMSAQSMPLSGVDSSTAHDVTNSEAAVVNERDIFSNLNPKVQKVIRPTLLDCENIATHKRIGKGNFGKVYHGTIVLDGEPVAVALKTLKDGPSADIEEIEDFLNEATVMKDFQHPNVLSLMGVILNPRDLYVVLPYMINGDLRKYAARQMFEFKTFAAFTLDIARGMEYLSSKRFVHRDLAARNCMVNAAGVVLIGDFGLAKDIYVADYYRPEGRNKPMPFKWMAPECLDERLFTTKSDTWAYGVTVWEVYTQGDRPYPMVENLDLLIYLERGHRLEQPANCPEPVFQVMRRCWEMDADLRPNFTELLNLLNTATEQVLNDTQHSFAVSPGVATVQVKPEPMVQSQAENAPDGVAHDTSLRPLLHQEDAKESKTPGCPDSVPREDEPVSTEQPCEGAVGGVPASTLVHMLPPSSSLRAGSSSEDEDGYLKPVRRN